MFNIDRTINAIWGWKGGLISPSSNAVNIRKKTAAQMGDYKMRVGATGCCMVGLSMFSLIASRRYPLLGAAFTTFGAAGALASREAFTVAQNIENLMEDGFPARLRASWSNDAFVDAALKNTLIVKPFYAKSLARNLDD